MAEVGSEWTAEGTVKQLRKSGKSGEVDEQTACPVSNIERPEQREGGGRMRGERKQKSVPRCGCRRDTDWLYPTRPVRDAKLGQREITGITETDPNEEKSILFFNARE